ncbi:MAG: hypothetical protein JXA90_05285 [Planctomycetes bacterium]|nr:hypothetical protein [Planctomycetota bacterium]
MKRRRARATAAVLWLLAAASGCGQGKLRLELQLAPGTTRRLELTIESRSEQETPMGPQGTSQKLVLLIAHEVKGRTSEGNHEIVARYESLRLEVTAPGLKILYDSSAPSAAVPAEATALAALAGEQIEMELSPQGRILRLDGWERVLEKMLSSLKASPEMRPRMEEDLRRLAGGDALRSGLEMLAWPLPPGPVAPGEAWTGRMDWDLAFPLRFDMRLTLSRRSGGMATIAHDTQISTPAGGRGLELMAPDGSGSTKLSYRLRGTQKGTTVLEESTGWPARGLIIQSLEGALILEGAGISAPVEIPTRIESRLTLRSVDPPAEAEDAAPDGDPAETGDGGGG